MFWESQIDLLSIKAWKNKSEVANYAAVGLSLLLVADLTAFNSFEIAEFGTGADYWMSKKKSNFILEDLEREARVEISGILKETKSNTVNMRFNLKKKQIKKSDDSNTPAWIAVIEFSTPKSKIEEQ